MIEVGMKFNELTKEIVDECNASGKYYVFALGDNEFEIRENIVSDSEKARIKQEQYETSIVSKIRQRYTIDQELAILRQRDTKPEEFFEYNEYVEECKAAVKEELHID